MNNKFLDTKVMDVFPFVKWVGGKRKVITNHLINHIPKKFNNYYEPFVGGGAMLFHLKPTSSIINDVNSELIISYKAIKKDYLRLIESLKKLESKKDKENFLLMRQKNDLLDDFEIAARFIYLNKLCFNGMYRVNSKGIFNVPYNGSTNVKLFNIDNLKNINSFFNDSKIDIFNDDFEKIIKMASKNDFMFVDPPYDYEENTKGFLEYSKSGFNKNEQIRLCLALKEAHFRGVKWMLTNHNTKLINELYKEFKITPIKTDRYINSKGDRRKNTGNEVFIINYEK